MDTEVNDLLTNTVPEFSRSRTGSMSLIKRLRPKQPRRNSMEMDTNDVSTNAPKKRVLSDFVSLHDEGIPMSANHDKQNKLSRRNGHFSDISDPIVDIPVNSGIDSEHKTRGVEVKVINGQIVVDSSSLNRQVNNYEYIDDDDELQTSLLNSNLKLKTKRWTPNDTAKFYKCLLQCGTDFSVMNKFFPDRNRKELKNKFKHEEKTKPELISMYLNRRYKQRLDLQEISNIEKSQSLILEENSNKNSGVSSQDPKQTSKKTNKTNKSGLSKQNSKKTNSDSDIIITSHPGVTKSTVNNLSNKEDLQSTSLVSNTANNKTTSNDIQKNIENNKKDDIHTSPEPVSDDLDESEEDYYNYNDNIIEDVITDSDEDYY